jgi:hypothetical protein
MWWEKLNANEAVNLEVFGTNWDIGPEPKSRYHQIRAMRDPHRIVGQSFVAILGRRERGEVARQQLTMPNMEKMRMTYVPL